MCSQIKSVTNQIRKINAERCEVYHKCQRMTDLHLKWNVFLWSVSFFEYVMSHCNFKVLRVSVGKGAIKVHEQYINCSVLKQ